MIKAILISICCLCIISGACGQAGAGMKMSDEHKHYLDSIKSGGYFWRFPLMGAKVVRRGFDFPYPVGAMLNMITGDQEVLISDLKVGVNDREPVPFDFVKFGEVKATMQSVNGRLDLWLFPFMNIYGIIGKVWSKTEVQITAPLTFNSTAEFDGYTMGMGITLAGGYHGILTINDINYTWTDIDQIEGKVKTLMITPRVGYNFIFRHKPQKSVALWIGTTGFFVNRNTEGAINVADLNANIPKEKLQEITSEVSDWYQSLTRPQQEIVKTIAQKLIDKIDGNLRDAVIHYSLEKEPLSHWSLVAGGQYQFNKRWQARTEFGLLGGRRSVLLSVNYRWRW